MRGAQGTTRPTTRVARGAGSASPTRPATRGQAKQLHSEQQPQLKGKKKTGKADTDSDPDSEPTTSGPATRPGRGTRSAAVTKQLITRTSTHAMRSRTAQENAASDDTTEVDSSDSEPDSSAEDGREGQQVPVAKHGRGQPPAAQKRGLVAGGGMVSLRQQTPVARGISNTRTAKGKQAAKGSGKQKPNRDSDDEADEDQDRDKEESDSEADGSTRGMVSEQQRNSHRKGTKAEVSSESEDGDNDDNVGSDDDCDGDAGPKSMSGDQQRSGRSAGGGQKRTLLEVLEGRLDDAHLRKVLRTELALHPKNANAKQAVLQDLRDEYLDWHQRLRMGFSLLFYGWGSKLALLEGFARERLAQDPNGAILVVNGFNPRGSVREVVAAVAQALMQRSCRSSDPRQLLADIAQEPLDRRCYVVIHNIEGPGLRRDMALLSRLAACPQVHVVASTDHVLAAKLFDSAAFGLFQWQSINATTYQSYLREKAEVPGLLGGLSKSTEKRSAGTTLRSMVVGAQEVFRVLAEHQVEEMEAAAAGPGGSGSGSGGNSADADQGVEFAHLFRMCRERFLVSSEHSLHQLLIEFLDHELVMWRGGEEGSKELLYVPLDAQSIRDVLRDLDESREA